jgi:hypothetical protein
MVRVGLVDDAAPRLAEAAELLDSPNLGGINSYVLVNQARAAAAEGKIDEAHGFLAKALPELPPALLFSATSHNAKAERQPSGGR